MPTPDRAEASNPVLVLVEDDAHLREIFGLALSGRFLIRAAASPREARKLCREPDVRLLLTDYVLEGGDGVRLVRDVRAERPDLPCVLFSGQLSAAIWAQAINAGCRHVLAKPIALRTVLDVCAGLIAERDAAVLDSFTAEALEGLPWRGDLGRALHGALDHVRAGRRPIYLHVADETFPTCWLRPLFPQFAAAPDPAPGPAEPAWCVPAVHRLPLSEQTSLVERIGQRHHAPWFLTGDASPEELFERGRLAESLYFRLGGATLAVPSPAEGGDDTLLLCHWLLSTRPEACTLAPDADTWLRERLAQLDWTTLHALLVQAAAEQPGRPLDAAALQHGFLTLSLGVGVRDVRRYPDFVETFAAELRTAWDLLGRDGP